MDELTIDSPTEDDAAVARDKARRRARLLVGAAIGLVTVVGLLLKIGVDPILAAGRGLVALVTERPTAVSHHVAPAEPAPAPVKDALADLPADVRAALTRPEAEAGVSFRFQLSLEPPEICEKLGRAGLKNDGWKPLGEGPAHECMSELAPVPGSKPVARTIGEDPEAGGEVTLPPAPSTLFFTARGRGEHAIDTIRLKLNLEDASVDRAGREMLVAILNDLSSAIAWPIPDVIYDGIRRQRKAVTERGGIRAEVLPENGPIKRINVVLLLGTPATRLPSERFVALPPIPPEMMKKEERPRRVPPLAPPGGQATAPATDGTAPVNDGVVAEAPIDQDPSDVADEGPPASPPIPPPRP